MPCPINVVVNKMRCGINFHETMIQQTHGPVNAPRRKNTHGLEGFNFLSIRRQC